MSDLPPAPVVPGALEVDAPMAVKDAWDRAQAGDRTTEGAAVTAPGFSATVGAGPRRARRVVEAAADPIERRHNWLPIGPRNVGGRVRALVADPGNPLVMYAGSASGGVWKTVDGGESWFALWHDEPSLAVGAMAVSPADAAVLWAATGEVTKEFQVPGAGIWRSTDRGATWQSPVGLISAPDPANPTRTVRALSFDAIAAHPANRDRAWAVGPAGIFRTMDGGTSWQRFRFGEYWSDVAYSRDAGGAPTLFLVRATSDAGEATVVFLPDPDAAEATIRASLPDRPAALPAAVVSTVIAAPPPPAPAAEQRPKRGKIAVPAAAPGRAYVTFVDASDRHAGTFRSDNAQPAAPATGSSITWQAMVPGAGFARQRQGNYNLALAASPDGTALVFGMVDLFLHRAADAGPALVADPAPVDSWITAINWAAWDTDRGQHADQHAAAFIPRPGGPAGTLDLWVANDGGVARCANWPAGDPVWEKRSDGLVAAQMYDLSQSALVPSVVGCGFQDNGAWVSAGGPTWQIVGGGDGGSVAFDPDDPYRFLVTNQNRVSELHVPGRPRPERPGFTAMAHARTLRSGIAAADRSPFVADTLFDPQVGGRVFYSRRNVLYRRDRRSGDRWQPEPLGRTVELRHQVPVTGAAPTPTATLEVLPSPAAVKLGLVPQRNHAAVVEDEAFAVARCHSFLDAPYQLAAGDTLRVSVDGGAPIAVAFRAGGEIADLARASAPEVAAAVNARSPGLAAAICRTRPVSVTVVVRAAGTPLTLGGDGLAVVGLPAGTLRPSPAHHATATFAVEGRSLDGRRFTLQAGGGPVVTVDATRDAEQMATRFRQALDAATFAVGLRDLQQVVRLTATGAPPAQVNLAGAGAIGRLGFTPAAPARTLTTAPRLTYDLSGAPALTLDIGDGAAHHTITFDAAANFAHLARVTPVELARFLAAELAAHPAGVSVALELDLRHNATWSDSAEAHVSELAIAPGRPQRIWAGDSAGVLYRSDDGGATWRTIVPPVLGESGRKVEAVAIHPQDPDTVLVGHAGRTSITNDVGFLFKSTDDGGSWTAGGELKGPDGIPVGVNALEVDVDHPGHVWAATDVGVFRSEDFGSSWAPFNEGLPNARAMDLTFDPASRTLRVGLWGRGVWERHVGSRAPADTRLLVRANLLDDGTRPPLRGPDGLALPPGPVLDASPDIKVSRRVAVAGAGAVLDGVELDERIEHEPPTRGPSTVLVQVHNRGAFPSRNVRVTVLWAPLEGGLPPRLPAGLLAARSGGNAVPAALPLAPWTLIHDGTVPSDGRDHDIVAASQPRVLAVPYSWPAAVEDAPRIAVVALVTGDGDTMLRDERDVGRLVAAEAKAACHITTTLRQADDNVIVLRSLGGVPFQLVAPTVAAPAAALGLPLGGAAAPVAVSTGVPPFNLAAGAPVGFRVQLSEAAVVNLGASADFANHAAAQAREVADVITRDGHRSDVPIFGVATGPAGGRQVRVVRVGRAEFTLDGGSGAPVLGLAPGGPHVTLTGASSEPFNLTVGAPLDLRFTVRHDEEVRFDATTPEIAAAATAQPHEVRAVINRVLGRARLPVVAEAARVELVVRRSLTEPVRGGVTGGEDYADLVVAAAPVAAPDRPALFDLITVLGADRARRGTPNRVYLRSGNRGNVAVADARHRLWLLDLAAALPIAPAPIDTAVPATVPAEGTAIAEFTWDPGAVDAGRRFLILAIVDQQPDRALEPPASFPTLDAVHRFCLEHANAATRLVEVSA